MLTFKSTSTPVNFYFTFINLPELEGKRSGKYGNFFIRIMLSYKDGCKRAAMAFEIRTAIYKKYR